MLQRVWRCTVDLGRAGEYEEFARGVSLPMFRSQQGYRGCIMARDGEHCEVLTLWEDEAAAEAAQASASYKATVARIRAAGFLSQEFGTTVVPIHEAEMIDCP